jgi:hypothetical protein
MIIFLLTSKEFRCKYVIIARSKSEAKTVALRHGLGSYYTHTARYNRIGTAPKGVARLIC